jgi:hypothetical protein
MRDYLLTGILFFNFIPIMKSQDGLSLQKEDIAGRWVERKRMEGNSIKQVEFPDTYIFRDNMVFHKGEAADGVIVFNITGRYTIDADSIVIYYNNYLLNRVNRQKPKKMQLKALSVSRGEMLVLIKDYDYEYRMLLNKQAQ